MISKRSQFCEQNKHTFMKLPIHNLTAMQNYAKASLVQYFEGNYRRKKNKNFTCLEYFSIYQIEKPFLFMFLGAKFILQSVD